ncbi:MAG TPA: tetratricopeptide repeat protein [Casimicrobiaceae bacterium]|nr:tetratricopeptide repeat protein [Casimicrobiaceae bacterium]
MDGVTRPGFARALEAHKRGDVAAAEAAYRALHERAPHPEIAHMLGLALYQQQRLDEALEWFERARRSSHGTSLHVNYASALLAAGRAAEAEAEARLALSNAPEHEGARLNLALALEAQRRFGAAAAAFAALSTVPAVAAVARRGQARSLMHAGRLDEAREALRAAEEYDDPETALVRGELALESGRLDEAEAALSTVVDARSARTRAPLLRARLAAERRDSDAALMLLDEALAVDPSDRAALLQSTPMLLQRADVARCLDRLHAWVEAHPSDAEVHSLYLRCAQYSPDFDAARLLEAHRGWAAACAAGPQFLAPRSRSPGERLRIGWLSPAFRNGPVQTFFLATLRELEERGLSENVLYNCNPRHEPSSVAFRASCRSWAEVAELGDVGLVDRVRGDRVDVLVDLAGHARGGRLVALARRAAPVQVTWLDSFGTTGIEAMDFVLTDSVSTPSGGECGFTENVLRLPRGRLCYQPPLPAQRPGPGSRRLISLNHFAKLNDSVIAVWADILRALPEWTLCLKARGGGDAGVVAALRSRFARHGIEPLRVEFSDYATVPQALAMYRDAAIALDPFPFSGGASSFDALWMGLPLVTWPRDTLVSRQGASLLHALDRPDWIARDARDYVAIACDLAADRPGRARWSGMAAARVGERLGDARAFATDLIAALERAWRFRAEEGFAAVSGKHGRCAA